MSAAIMADLRNTGDSIRVIALRHGVTDSEVQAIRRRSGMPRRDVTVRAAPGPRLTPEQIAARQAVEIAGIGA